jgi:DNA-binding response OmpR family regulator
MNTPNQHVLIVNNDLAIAKILQEALETKGYKVIWNHSSDDIICFEKPPDISNFDTCYQVRIMLLCPASELEIVDKNVLNVGTLVIDWGRGHVRRDNKLILLTPIEFRILVFLAQHQGQAITRRQILDAVWGYEAISNINSTINAHIRRLREKIEIDPYHPTLIKTIMGIGYQLSGE